VHVTLAEIAHRLGVSKVTVSKALRGHPDISPETAGEVKRVARELGYVPNYIARSLSSSRTNTIGVVVPKIAHVFFSSVIEALYDSALENGYEIVLTVSQESAEREARHLQSLLSMRVDGLIVSLSALTHDYAMFHWIRELGVPLTLMDRVIDDERFTRVVVDDFGGAFAAAEQAIKVGYRKLAHLGGLEGTNIGRERARGFAAALERHGIPLRSEWIIRGGFGEEDGYHGFMRLRESGDMPEFIFTATFPQVLGVYRAAAECGMSIPADIDIICFGNTGLSHILPSAPTYIEQPTKDLGVKAFELTLKQIREKAGPTLVVLPTKLIVCQTAVPRRVAL
jgi:LacI family transcriptional regulator